MQHVKLTGFKDLERALLELGEKTAKRVGRAALRKTAKPILDHAKAKVPVHQGRLKKALRIKVDQEFSGGKRQAAMKATIDVSGAGAKDYRKRKTQRRSTVKGKLQDARYDYQIGSRPDVYGKFVEFGTVDMAPQPFLRPAWDAEGGETAIRRMGKEIGEGIEREAAKLKR